MDTFSAIITPQSAISLPRFQTKSGEKAIDLGRIVYLNARLNYMVFHLSNGEQVG